MALRCVPLSLLLSTSLFPSLMLPNSPVEPHILVQVIRIEKSDCGLFSVCVCDCVCRPCMELSALGRFLLSRL